MAKEFKAFDKKYKHLAGTALKTIQSLGGHIAKGDIVRSDHWPWMSHFTEDYANPVIRYAVYEVESAEDWQKFRVSLKGLSTHEKMFALLWYWDVHIASGPGAYLVRMDYDYQIIRINNYLGALKRGGQLDSQLRVVK